MLTKTVRSALLSALLLAPTLPQTDFPLSPRAAHAQTTSALTGIAIPRKGARFDDIAAPFSKLLTALSKEKVVGLTPTGDDAEVFVWKGGSYREDRVPFTKTALSNALKAAGYEVNEIEEVRLRDVNVYEFFDSNDASLPFHQSTMRGRLYFKASSQTRGRAVLGAWLEDDDALALGLLPVEFTAKAKPASLPGTAAGTVLIKDPNDTAKSLPAPKMPTFPRLAPRPGTVRGVALDGGGRPIAGAVVAVYSSIGGGVRTTHRARTNARGAYQVIIPQGIGEVAQASCTVNFNGVKYELLLHPVRGHFAGFNAARGHVENFVLRTQGEFGGTVMTRHSFNSGTVEVTLTPVGRLLDGTTGRTLVYRLPTNKSDAYLNGIPLGRYRLTARLLDEGEALPVQAGLFFGTDEQQAPKSAQQIDFEPGYTFSESNPGKTNSRVQTVKVSLRP